MSTELPPDQLRNVFEERAEYLSREDLEQWTYRTPADKKILAKLKGPGPKLLTGPRGSGKSTLLKEAYFELMDGRDALPLYVNYANSLALEPLFHRAPNALQVFRQWVLMKIIVAAANSLAELWLAHEPEDAELIEDARRFIDALSAGQDPPTLKHPYGTTELCNLLERWSEGAGRRRVVLLLDDAAHAFSHQQQREFFEVFRELRTRRVAAKAAVYPGITSYSPYMHVGHEAELVEAWYRPDSDDYLDTMRSIVARRIPPSLLARLAGREELIDYLALASFGLPRGFLVMLSDVLGVDDVDEGTSPTKRRADDAIKRHAESVREVFRSLKLKLPRYRHFVDVGGELERAFVGALRSFNLHKAGTNKAVMVGMADPHGPELTKVVEMLEYAGLIRELGTVSRGVKGVFRRYELHYAIIIDDNALSLGKSVSTAAVVSALVARNASALVRGQGRSFLGQDFVSRCTLDLAPCQNCGAPRLSDDAQFCMKCGRPLTEASVYEELLNASIDLLPLTPNKRDALKQTQIRTIKDVLLDDESAEIRKAPYVGAIWSARIHRYAEEFVSV